MTAAPITSITAVGAYRETNIRRGVNFTYGISGTYVGTILVQEASASGDGWTTIGSVTSGNLAAIVTVPAGNSDYQRYRFFCSSYTSGTASVYIGPYLTVTNEWFDSRRNLLLRLSGETDQNEVQAYVPGRLTAGGDFFLTGNAYLAGSITMDGAIAASGGITGTTGSGMTAVATGATVTEGGAGVVHQTSIALAATAIAVTDANAYGSVELADFPEGRILILGVTATLQWAVTTDRATTINDNAALKWALGSAAASNATLSAAMVDMCPKTSKTLSAATTDLNTASNAALAASAQFDGTSSAAKAYLNAAFETGADIDGDGTLAVTGTVTITWINLGDY